jgi:hypothetical protein
MTRLTPIESEFATSEDAEAHDRWVREKVETALASTAPPVPHDSVISEAKTIIETRRSATTRLAG